MDNNTSAARSARKFLDVHIRDDWHWPSPPPPQSAAQNDPPGASEYRERSYGTDSGSEAETDKDEAKATVMDPYKFDSPDAVDAVAVAVEDKMMRRKRKRRRVLEEEMAWNEGLAVFVERRDYWTGATNVVRPKPSGGSSERVSSPQSGTDRSTSDGDVDMLDSKVEAPIESLIPVARPLLQDNPIRSSISPKLYPEIYNKIVVSARTPSVPINLSDMTKALVQGWKDNGEWPPKATPLDPLAGRRKAALASAKMEKEAGGEEHFLSHHPHMKKGMESVKRIFHLSGTHSSNGAGDAG